MDTIKNAQTQPAFQFVRMVGQMAEYEDTTPEPVIDRSKAAEYAIRMATALAIPPREK